MIEGRWAFIGIPAPLLDHELSRQMASPEFRIIRLIGINR
jgi:hypothetical protein